MWHTMWHGWGVGWYGWGAGMIGMALFWIVVIGAVVLAVRALGDRTTHYAGTPRPPRETPFEILQRRYAAGEIDRREFEEKKKDLS